MRVTITGRHMEITEALKARVQESLEKARGHFDRLMDADVVLSVEKHRHIVEITLHANGARFHGKVSSPDMYTSVDAVADKLNKQIRKFKDRNHSHKARKVSEAADHTPDVDEGMEQSGGE